MILEHRLSLISILYQERTGNGKGGQRQSQKAAQWQGWKYWVGRLMG